MGFAFRAMIWIIAFNLAVGVTIIAFGQTNWLLTPGGDVSGTKGLQQTEDLNTLMAQEGSVPVEETSFWYRFLDVISLGFYNKIRNFLSVTIFSIPTLFTAMGILPESLVAYFNGGIILIFVLGMFELFTGKDLTLR